jgi:flagellar FliL protein
MSAAAAAADSGEAQAAPKGGKRGKKKLLMIAVPLLLVLIGAGLWFAGLIPGSSHEAAPSPEQHAKETANAAPIFVDLPDMVSNLSGPGRRPSFVKLKAKVELARAEDVAAFNASQPRVVDLFQTYLREMRPEEFRSSIGTYRLRQELLSRANIAVAPVRVVDILFTELLVQ